MTNENEDVDTEILRQIEALRAEYGACTARLVADRMRMNREMIRYRMQKLRDDGLITWNDVPGSLRLSTDEVAGPEESASEQSQ